MIRLEKFEFCDDCPEFEPDVEKPVVLYAGDKPFGEIGDTIIRCEHRHVCEHVAKFFKSKLWEETDGCKQ